VKYDRYVQLCIPPRIIHMWYYYFSFFSYANNKRDLKFFNFFVNTYVYLTNQ